MGKGGDATPVTTTYTWEEVRKHSSRSSAWIVIRDSVYDVTAWGEHPGGDVVFALAGMDATDPFSNFHPPSASLLLGQFKIGELVSDAKRLPTDGNVATALGQPIEHIFSGDRSSVIADYRELRTKFRAMGLFQASFLYYAYKFFSNLGLLVLAGYLATLDSFVLRTLSAVILALFWQQCGWLAHDFLHHQVFQNRLYGDLAGLIVGGLFQGFSVDWWKDKHNTHHAVPNLEEIDPDISTAPLLTWSKRLAFRYKDTKVARLVTPLQHVLYFPILAVARLSWCIQSLLGVIYPRYTMRHRFLEGVVIFLHWASYLTFIFSVMPLAHAFWYILVSQASGGILLALVFAVGHNGMHTFVSVPDDFLSLQVLSTRNAKPSLFVNWFMGGLQFQIEHHLFPGIPRHHLATVQPFVKSLCKKHSIPYHEPSLVTGNIEVLDTLAQIAHSIEHFG
eukprot:TRINITY_DN1085_c0_g1_i1.p1 TRINITY_DN1085_c0_g1~~TRINITY_DN1085_c0_g1_i1.p1  ORF type:complete len:467 (+),score=110.27 TRINITY_DN1085_c0_g1_i1:57-1403(+)